jgi:hypothetical protein
MYLNTMANMCAITFEMMAEVTNKKMLDEDEFFHVCELQYFVTRLN